jgi:D-apiose dehydrogenase
LSSRPLRVAIIGAGDISRYHLAAWRRLPDVDVSAICDRDPKRAAHRAAEAGVDAVYHDAADMLASQKLDAVDIATTRETHVELCLLAADCGVDVLCQKPLAPSLTEARSLIAKIDGRIRLMVHENRRFAPHFQTIRGWVDAGLVGPVRQVVMTTYRSSLIKSPDGARPAVTRAAYYAAEPRLLIGEALIHQLDVLRFLLGPLDVVAARELHTEPDLPGETVASLLLEVRETGAPVVLAGSYVSPGFAGSGGGSTALGAQTADRLDIAGSVSSVVMNDSVLALRGEHLREEPVDYGASYQYCFDAAIAHFVERLRSGEPFDTAPEDNLQTLELVEAAYRLAGRP